MEILRENFLEVLPILKDAIDESDFIAIDGEFTGIGSGLPSKVLFDTPSQRYLRLKADLSGIIIIQYGICTFKWNKETQTYDAKPFNCYVFPRPYKGKEPFFKCQSSSLEFLASQNFDFNKLVNHGLSFMAPAQEASLRKKFQHFYDRTEVQTTPKTKSGAEGGPTIKSPLFIPSTMKEFVEDTCSKVEEFIASENTSLDLPKASAFKRKLTYEVIEERFPSKFFVETVTINKTDKHMRIRKVDEKEWEKLQSSKNAERMAEFETAVGFLTIAKHLSRSQKLIVGHNMLIDMMLTVGQFFTALPDSYDEFKDIVQTLFPRLIDTKLLATSEPLKRSIHTSVVDPLYKLLKENFEEPKIEFAEGFQDYDGESEKLHEAGYDAYCTGFSFAKMAAHLCKAQQSESELKEIDLKAEILKPFINRVFVMRINNLTYLTLDGPDAIPERKHVFHIQFPSTWKYGEISSTFAPFGNVYVSFLDETSAFVSLDEPEKADEAIESLVVQKNSGFCQVVTYKQFVGVDAPEKYDNQQPRKDCNGKERKKGRKRKLDEKLEEGEVASSPEADEDDGEIVESADLPVKNDIASIPPRNKKKPSKSKEFYEPDDW